MSGYSDKVWSLLGSKIHGMYMRQQRSGAEDVPRAVVAFQGVGQVGLGALKCPKGWQEQRRLTF